MKIAYAVSTGVYDDYRICRIYLSKENAEAWCLEQNKLGFERHKQDIERYKKRERSLYLVKIYETLEEFIKDSYDNYYLEEFDLYI